MSGRRRHADATRRRERRQRPRGHRRSWWTAQGHPSRGRSPSPPSLSISCTGRPAPSPIRAARRSPAAIETPPTLFIDLPHRPAGPIADPGRSIFTGSDRNPADPLHRSPAPAGPIADPRRSIFTDCDRKPADPRNRSPARVLRSHRRSAPLDKHRQRSKAGRPIADPGRSRYARGRRTPVSRRGAGYHGLPHRAPALEPLL